jgi:hypothetical protein
MTDVLLTVGFVAALALLYWLAHRMEPHWVAKDGQRFIAKACRLNDDGSTGRWREARFTVTLDGDLDVRPRGIAPGGLRGSFGVVGRTANPPKKLQVYLLQGESELLLRVPSTSRAVPELDRIARQPPG